LIPTTNEILAAMPWLVFAILVPILLRRRVRLNCYAAPAADAAPFVSIIVPARNEAENITMCVSTLLLTDYPHWELIVVDDNSVDGTADIVRMIAERSGGVVRLLEGQPLPDGWLGKSWACWQGYQAARGEMLLFTDADTRHHPDLLGYAVGAALQEKADLTTVLPRQLMEGFWERVVLPHVFVAIMLRFHDVSRISRARTPRDAIANGQFMLFLRSSYEAIGGHERVRGNVVEDLRLAQLTVEERKKVFAAHAEDLMETRMYRSLAGIVEGWSKNLALGSKQAVAPWLAPIVPWLLGLLELAFWVAPPAVLIASFFTSVSAFVWGWALSATVFSLLFWIAAHAGFRIPLLHALLYPLGAVVTALMFFRSAFRGEIVAWRGRRYRRDKVVS
jgi:chlorobactene glucosyltransferase